MELLRIFRFFFFRSADVKSWGCVLYAGAPYTRDFTVIDAPVSMMAGKGVPLTVTVITGCLAFGDDDTPNTYSLSDELVALAV